MSKVSNHGFDIIKSLILIAWIRVYHKVLYLQIIKWISLSVC